MKKEIRFNWDSEKRIKVSQAGPKNSLFYEAYRQALAGVTEIILASRKYTDCDASHVSDQFYSPGAVSDASSDYSPQKDKNFYNYPSNLIVFNGERGAGKSTAMLTFIDSLKNRNSPMFNKVFLTDMVSCEMSSIHYEEALNLYQSCDFMTLLPIDPTALENGGQILIVILARMFQRAEEIWNESSSFGRAQDLSRTTKKQDLIDRFETCYDHIRAIKGKSTEGLDYDGLSVLSSIGDSTRLKMELAALVNDWLQFCAPQPSREPFLILQIDDTDMNIQQAYDILEDIRKYLVIPRVIIVMAANLNHLVQVIESGFLKSYDASVFGRVKYVNNIAHQYVTKLFPQTRQINLPPLNTYLTEHTETCSIHYTTQSGKVLPDSSKNFPDTQEQIFRLIYRKTGMVFLKVENQLHYIIPANMRTLSHFLTMLVQMKDIENPDDPMASYFFESARYNHKITPAQHLHQLEIRLQNVQRFRDYFTTTWAGNTLSSKDAKLLADLGSINISGKVRFACKCVHAKIGDKGELESASYVTLLDLCRTLEEKAFEKGAQKFVFAIHTYFSLLCHCIVLENLIDYYSGTNKSPSDTAWLGCSFPQLYSLFASRIFSYQDGAPSAADKEVVGAGKEGAGSATSAVYPFKMRWETKQPSTELRSGTLQFVKITASLLYSMLADYKQSISSDTLWVDVCTPIINCLYLGDTISATPYAQKLFSASSEIKNIDSQRWLIMRNSALTVALNWDVQRVIGREVLLQMAQNKELAELPSNTWLSILKNFYMRIVEPFNKGTTSITEKLKRPTETCPAIRSLEFLDFSAWLDRVVEAALQEPSLYAEGSTHIRLGKIIDALMKTSSPRNDGDPAAPSDADKANEIKTESVSSDPDESDDLNEAEDLDESDEPDELDEFDDIIETYESDAPDKPDIDDD